jgi:hypothetical protein
MREAGRRAAEIFLRGWKTCIGCEKDLPIENFYTYKRQDHEELMARCKACYLIQTRTWRQTHKEESKAIYKRWLNGAGIEHKRKHGRKAASRYRAKRKDDPAWRAKKAAIVKRSEEHKRLSIIVNLLVDFTEMGHSAAMCEHLISSETGHKPETIRKLIATWYQGATPEPLPCALSEQTPNDLAETEDARKGVSSE